MRILIVDDNPRRYQRLNERLAAHGIARKDIHIVSCAMDARDRLSANKYELMIVDLLIPLRIEDDPASSNSEELLREIVEFENLLKPKQIIGLTAYTTEVSRSITYCASVSWTVIKYSDTDESWIAQVIKCVEYVQSEALMKDHPTYKTDLAIICALADPEMKAVLRLPWNWQPPQPLDDTTFIHRGTFSAGNSSRSVVLTSLERMGMVSAALISSKIITELQPRLLAMTGICAGIAGKTSIGDVVLADPCWDWQSGKRAEIEGQPTFSIAPHQISLDPALRARFDQMKGERRWLDEICDRWPGDVPGRSKLLIGPIATGSAVLADGSSMDVVKEQHRELLGVEMEAYGVYSAARVASKLKPLFFALKSVCDFGDGTKNDMHQKYCAYVSAETLRYFCENHYAHM